MPNSLHSGFLRTRGVARACLSLAILGTAAMGLLMASDHGDVPVGVSGPRQDANLTDLHAFVVGQNLVLALSTNPAIPPSATSYVFPTDVTFEFHIDNHSRIENGQVVEPRQIADDVTFRIRFRPDGSAKLERLLGRGHEHGNDAEDDDDRGADRHERDGGSADPRFVNFFAGLRDDPFIRGPRQGRNVGAIVLEVPLSSVLRPGKSMLILWATSRVSDFDGPFQDLAGRALLSMFPENSQMNSMEPRLMLSLLGKAPDVMIFNTALPAAFPNGRALTDDVVDIVGDNRVLANDAPFPSANDKPFLGGFPYLAQPH